VALVFQMRVVDKRAVKERIGTLNPAVFSQLLQELDRLLGR
jgi:mRNA-degrading endonuclease toxin of MazEF toxin-antitoxin module